jgi:hypothetical protein
MRFAAAAAVADIGQEERADIRSGVGRRRMKEGEGFRRRSSSEENASTAELGVGRVHTAADMVGKFVESWEEEAAAGRRR